MSEKSGGELVQMLIIAEGGVKGVTGHNGIGQNGTDKMGASVIDSNST